MDKNLAVVKQMVLIQFLVQLHLLAVVLVEVLLLLKMLRELVTLVVLVAVAQEKVMVVQVILHQSVLHKVIQVVQDQMYHLTLMMAVEVAVVPHKQVKLMP